MLSVSIGLVIKSPLSVAEVTALPPLLFRWYRYHIKAEIYTTNAYAGFRKSTNAEVTKETSKVMYCVN